MSDPRRIILSDQHPWTFIHSIISYGAPSWFFLLGRIIIKVWDLSPMQRLKFMLPHNHEGVYIYTYTYMTFFYSTFYEIATNTLIKFKILISIGFKFYTGMHSFFIIIFSYYLSYFSLTSKRINKNFSHKYLNSWIPHYKLIDRLTQFIILNFCTHLLSSWIHLEIDR